MCITSKEDISHLHIMITTEMCESSYNLFNYYDTPQTSGHVEAMENS